MLNVPIIQINIINPIKIFEINGLDCINEIAISARAMILKKTGNNFVFI